MKDRTVLIFIKNLTFLHFFDFNKNLIVKINVQITNNNKITEKKRFILMCAVLIYMMLNELSFNISLYKNQFMT